MAKILFISTHDSEDPTRATLPWLLAKGAAEAGHEARIVLSGDGAILAHRAVAEGVQGIGIPPLRELIAHARAKGVPVFV